MPLLVLPSPESELGPVVPMLGVPGRFIGATLDLEATKAAGGKFRFVFDDCPVKVDDNPFYRRAVVEGHLVAADETTAKVCGVRFDPHVAKKAEERAKAKADAKAKAKAEAAKAANPPAPPAPETSPETPAATAERKGARKES